MKLSEAIAELNAYKNLEDNWDGYGAPPIPEEIITKAIGLLLYIYSVFPDLEGLSVAPTPDESITLEWYIGKNCKEMNIEVYAKNKANVILSFPINTEVSEPRDKNNLSDLNALIETYLHTSN